MTQLEWALRGKLTEEMKAVAFQESLDPQELLQRVAEGRVVIPKNRLRSFLPQGIGQGLKTKVNANIGTSSRCASPEEEVSKLRAAREAGAHSIMDLSTAGDLDGLRKRMVEEADIMVGTVPLYALMTRRDLSPSALLGEIENQARQGVDFMTIHAGVTRRALSYRDLERRTAGIVSRGGSYLKKWMEREGQENPFYTHFFEILELCREYDVTVSLGDGLRPGAGADAGDAAQVAELLELGELVLRCREAGVQVMVEGPGHVPLDQIGHQMALMKHLCHGAPLYVLGPLVTDVAPGYDHITAAIGGAQAAAKGADFLCYVTPAEHLCLPDLEDVVQGVTASRIAAHAGDLAKGVSGASDWDREMSRRRKALDWPGQFRLALEPAYPQIRRASAPGIDPGLESCTMCGDLCSMKPEMP